MAGAFTHRAGCFNSSGGGGPDASTARYHRISFIQNFDSWKSLQVSEVQFRATAGGSKLIGTMTGTNAFSAGSNANDGNYSTDYITNGAFSMNIPNAGGAVLTLDLGAGNDAPCLEVAIAPRTGQTIYAPSEFIVEYSTNGSSWTTNWPVGPVSNTYADSTLRVFTRP